MTARDEQIADQLITRQIDLLRFSAGERAKVFALLKKLEEELIELLFFSGRKLTEIGREDKARLLSQAQKAIADHYGKASDEVGDTLGELGRLEATATAQSLGNLYAGSIIPALPTETVLKRLVDSTLIEGAPSAAWWKRQSGDLTFRFKNAVAQGMAAAETNDEIIRRIRGRAVGYKMVEGKRVYTFVGGVMDIARHHAAAQVQTSVMAVANQSRMDTFEANEDVVKGFRQLSTLDSHTTPTCVAYSGATWDFKKQPTGENTLPFVSPKGSATGTPRHWSCRSVISPITKSFRELGLDIPEFSPTTRAATGGPVAANMTFAQFIDRKGKLFADDLLGPGRAELWREGKITLPQLLDQSGRPLTLKELRRRYG